MTAIAITKISAVECWNIDGAPGLDPIHIFWMNVDPGKGSVTIICYGCAWTAYFGAMGNDRTIQQFFADADTSYMHNEMGIRPMHLKHSKRNESYLRRIIDAVKESLALSQGRGPATAAGKSE